MATDHDDDVQLPDLQVIQRYSLAVRGATARRADVVAALEADLAWLTGGRRRSTAPERTPSAAPTAAAASSAARKSAAPDPAADHRAASRTAPAKKARVKKAAAKAPAKQAAAKAPAKRTPAQTKPGARRR